MVFRLNAKRRYTPLSKSHDNCLNVGHMGLEWSYRKLQPFGAVYLFLFRSQSRFILKNENAAKKEIVATLLSFKLLTSSVH